MYPEIADLEHAMSDGRKLVESRRHQAPVDQ
jgi:hypothetical protein